MKHKITNAEYGVGERETASTCDEYERSGNDAAGGAVVFVPFVRVVRTAHTALVYFSDGFRRRQSIRKRKGPPVPHVAAHITLFLLIRFIFGFTFGCVASRLAYLPYHMLFLCQCLIILTY